MGLRTAPQILFKAGEEITLRDFDFAGNELVEGETVALILLVTITPTGDPADLALDAQATSGTKVQLTLSKGRDGVQYDIHVKVRTSTSQELAMCGRLNVGPC